MALYPHVMRILILKLPYLDNTRLQHVTKLQHEIKFFLLSFVRHSQIWQSPVADDGQPTYLMNLKRKTLISMMAFTALGFDSQVKSRSNLFLWFPHMRIKRDHKLFPQTGGWYLVLGPVHKSSGPPMAFVAEIGGTKLCKVQTRDKAQRLAEIGRQIRRSPMEVGGWSWD